MGWDVVEIGLKHDLPVEDAFATAKEVAERMKRNVKLCYRNEYEYDALSNTIHPSKDYSLKEIAFYKVDDSDSYLQMTVENYQAKEFFKRANIDKLKTARYTDKYIKEQLIDDIEETFELYEIEGIENREPYIRIFKETVDLGIYVTSRWSRWTLAFHDKDQLELLADYRKQIVDRAKLFGCREVIICSDQGPGMDIFENINIGADELKDYTSSFKYLEENTWLDKEETEEWRKTAKHISFPDFLRGNVVLSDEDFVEVIYDDLSDI